MLPTHPYSLQLSPVHFYATTLLYATHPPLFNSALLRPLLPNRPLIYICHQYTLIQTRSPQSTSSNHPLLCSRATHPPSFIHAPLCPFLTNCSFFHLSFSSYAFSTLVTHCTCPQLSSHWFVTSEWVRLLCEWNCWTNIVLWFGELHTILHNNLDESCVTGNQDHEMNLL